MSAPPRSADPAPRRRAAAVGLALLLPLAASFGATTAVAEEPPLRTSAKVAALERGLFCATPEGARRDAPDTEFGWIHIPDEPVAMRREGAVVPAVLGLGFGIDYTLAGSEPVLIRHVVEHPPMPPSRRVRQTWESWVIGGTPEVVFFQFDIDDELLPGRWTFTALDGDEEILHAAFDVVPPAAAPHLTALCSGAELLTLNR
jgi:hypothetical protein